MEVAAIYVIVIILRGVLPFVAIGLILGAVVEHKVGNRKAVTVLSIGAALALIFGQGLYLWHESHHSYPEINDWKFIGKNIYDIEETYGEFEDLRVSDSGSGDATLMTERIVGHDMYDSGDYSVYHMVFDDDGTIRHTYCSRPIGG